MDKTLISVIIPVYNVQDYLEECLESVLAQTYTHLEIILVDDGSIDRSGEICDKYAAGDSRIAVIHQKNGGLSAARNAGIDLCTGEYVSFIDSDDVVSPDFIDTLYCMCVESGSKVAVVGIGGIPAGTEKHRESIQEKKQSIEKNGKNPSCKVFSSHQILDRFYDMNVHNKIVVAWNKLYRRDVIGEFRYPEGFVYEDEATTFAYLYRAGRVAWTDERLYYYRNRTGSITKSGFNLKRLDVLEAYDRRRKIFAFRSLPVYGDGPHGGEHLRDTM